MNLRESKNSARKWNTETQLILGAALAVCAAFVFLFVVVPAPRVSAQGHPVLSAQTGHEGMSMPGGDAAPMDASQMKQMMEGKAGSEFNHHLAGIFVLLAGLFILVGDSLPQRRSFFQFAWPACFLISGIFLLLYSDKELWPFGPVSWWYSLSNDREVLQHKVFAVILLAIAYFEIQRARGISKQVWWSKWAFPVLACVGSVMLLFHEHGVTPMTGMDHMALMAHIQTEHEGFAAAGFGIGIFKGLSELPTPWKELFSRLWSVLIIILGVLLLLYTE